MEGQNSMIQVLFYLPLDTILYWKLPNEDMQYEMTGDFVSKRIDMGKLACVMLSLKCRICRKEIPIEINDMYNNTSRHLYIAFPIPYTSSKDKKVFEACNTMNTLITLSNVNYNRRKTASQGHFIPVQNSSQKK